MKLMTIPERIPPKLWPQSLKEETTPEQRLAGRRQQILDDKTLEPRELHIPEDEDSWVKDFIDRLAGMTRNIDGKR
jgi:hypothetical protein